MCKMFISTGYGQCQVRGATLEMFLFLNSLHICASLCLGDEILVLNRFLTASRLHMPPWCFLHLRFYTDITAVSISFVLWWCCNEWRIVQCYIKDKKVSLFTVLCYITSGEQMLLQINSKLIDLYISSNIWPVLIGIAKFGWKMSVFRKLRQ